MKLQHIFSLLFGLSVVTTVYCNTEVDILNAQREAWKDPYNVLESWDPTLVNPCTWYHITCNSDNSVIRVDLGNASLSGYLIPDLGRLTDLQYLELYSNNISGSIPDSLGNLTKLVSLDLFSNHLNGPIPSSLGNINSLKYLELYSNNISGSIPASLGNLTKLVSLDLFNNNLSGPIPSSLGNIKSLKYLRLNNNMLSGEIPREVLELIITGNLTEMNVSDNMLSGTIRNFKKRVTTITQDARA